MLHPGDVIRLCRAPFPLITEGVMKKFLVSLMAIIALSGAFIADSVAAFPLNQCDWKA
jgi:hypothetical protein